MTIGGDASSPLVKGTLVAEVACDDHHHDTFSDRRRRRRRAHTQKHDHRHHQQQLPPPHRRAVFASRTFLSCDALLIRSGLPKSLTMFMTLIVYSASCRRRGRSSRRHRHRRRRRFTLRGAVCARRAERPFRQRHRISRDAPTGRASSRVAADAYACAPGGGTRARGGARSLHRAAVAATRRDARGAPARRRKGRREGGMGEEEEGFRSLLAREGERREARARAPPRRGTR